MIAADQRTQVLSDGRKQTVRNDAHRRVRGPSITLRGPGGLEFDVSTYGGTVSACWRRTATASWPTSSWATKHWSPTWSVHPTSERSWAGMATGSPVDGSRWTARNTQLAVNNGPHHLHGGERGFDKVVWEAEPYSNGGTVQPEVGAVLGFVSPDGDEGYPGELSVRVTYALTEDASFVSTTRPRRTRPPSST